MIRYPCGIKRGQDQVCIYAEQRYPVSLEDAGQGCLLEHVQEKQLAAVALWKTRDLPGESDVRTSWLQVLCQSQTLSVLGITAQRPAASSTFKISLSKPPLGCLRSYVHGGMIVELPEG